MNCQRHLKPFAAIAFFAAATATADTYDVAAETTKTLSGVTETSATVKTGDGTLELSGANSLKRLRVSAGSLHISGGSTTISDSTATGTSVGSCVMESETGAQSILIDGGSTVTLSAGKYANFRGGVLTITNATLNATGITDLRIAHGGVAAGGSKVVIGDGGVLRAGTIYPAGSGATTEAFKDIVGLQLDKGGSLYADKFTTDGYLSRYGRIWFNGGTFHPGSQYFFTGGNNVSYPWLEGHVAPTIMTGGAFIHADTAVVVYPPFHSGVQNGERDGGVHFPGKAEVSWHAKNSTFNGGVWLESGSGAMLKVSPEYGDSVFGAVPETPEANIFVTGANHILYAQYYAVNPSFSINPNRNVSIANGIKFRTAAAANARLVIGGEINGEHAANETWSTNTILEAYIGSGWAGTTVIGPGDGRTNDIGQLVVSGSLEVTNGVTVVASAKATSGTANAVLHVYGNSSGSDFSATRGKLSVTGGTLYAPQSGSRYVYVTQYGQVDVCGGTVYMPNIEWLNAQNSIARTIIRDGGVLDVGTFRVAQNVTGNPTVVHLATNGILRTRQIVIDTDQTAPAVTFLFDGGAVQSAIGANDTTGSIEATRGTNDFIRFPANPKWDGVTFAIGPGGAVFDTDNNQHIYWRRPLVKAVAGEPDGGITVRGTKNKSVIFYDNLDYNGPTTVDGDCTLQLRAGSLPTGTRLILKNGGKAGFTTYDAAHTPTAATLDSIEGDGKLTWCRGVTVTNAIAPSIGGTLTLHEACALDGTTLTITGDSTGCGKLAFEAVQDISGVTLSMADPSAFKKDAASDFYKIVDNGNYSGQFQLAADWPDDWAVKYESNGVYLRHINAFVMVLR